MYWGYGVDGAQLASVVGEVGSAAPDAPPTRLCVEQHMLMGKDQGCTR